ncbi:hypothetical protein FACS189462_1170 [Spirochaetia bacterium]|nr:hypothetical protein FACS189462_1170 [Spirochaetia bacterium]
MTDSKITQDYQENVAKGKIVKTFCNNCGKDINHEVIMDYFHYGNECTATGTISLANFVPDYDKIEWKDDYQILKCKGCDCVSFRKFGWFSEYQDMIDDGSYEELYPERERRKQKDFSNMPINLNSIYKEAIATYNMQTFILCAAGIRALLEGICKNKDITDWKLDKKIETMCIKGIITSAQKDALHQLQFLGNDALHDLATPKTEEIEAALDIVEHIIDDIYEVPAKAAILKRR